MAFNFSEFKPPIAVVDWISILVELRDNSHAGYLKNHYESHGVSHVTPLDKGDGSAASRFEIRIQNPASYETIRTLIEELRSRYGLVATPEILAIEVSVDFYHQKSNPADLERMTQHLMNRVVPPVINNPRLIGDKLDQAILLPSKNPVDPTRTLYIGNKDEDHMWRVYWKRTDDTFVGEDNIKVTKPLPLDEHRARVEVSLTGKALNELSLFGVEDLKDFKFECLHTAGFFKFANLKAGVKALFTSRFAIPAAKALGVGPTSPACVINMFGKRRRGRTTPRVLNKHLQTDTILTEKIRNALRELSRRF